MNQSMRSFLSLSFSFNQCRFLLLTMVSGYSMKVDVRCSSLSVETDFSFLQERFCEEREPRFVAKSRVRFVVQNAVVEQVPAGVPSNSRVRAEIVYRLVVKTLGKRNAVRKIENWRLERQPLIRASRVVHHSGERSLWCRTKAAIKRRRERTRVTLVLSRTLMRFHALSSTLNTFQTAFRYWEV